MTYVKKDGFKNLRSTKGLEKLITAKAEIARSIARAPSISDKYQLLATGFCGFDSFEEGQKKQALTKACVLLQSIEAELNNADEPPPQPTKARQTRQPPQSQPKRLSVYDTLAAYENSVKRLATPVQLLTGVGPKLSELLNKKGMKTVGDVFTYLPLKYEDRRAVKRIAELETGEVAVIIAKVVDFSFVGYRARSVFEMVVSDASGSLVLKWFKAGKYLAKSFKRGDHLMITGTVRRFNHTRELHHPETKKITVGSDGATNSDSTGFCGIIPVYSETEGLKQNTIKKVIAGAIKDHLPAYFSPLDIDIAKKLNMTDITTALKNLHHPEPDESVNQLNSYRSKYHKRVIFDEFFYLELALALRKKGRVLTKGIKFANVSTCSTELKKVIPFKLTRAQEKVTRELAEDMRSSKPMNRLLQGDVGSGKTVIALFALYVAAKNGYQAAIMAPTEILATQHHKNLKEHLDKLGVTCTLLTGTLKKSERTAALEAIKSGATQVVIGTHAIIQDSVEFDRLGLAVIDEQHRFGVTQRATLMKKGRDDSAELTPDVLIMTATPIPRTLAITVYGDLDVSIIDEMPPGRKPVKTKVYYESQRAQVYELIMTELKAGHQAYIVYPLVSESEKLDLMDATNMAEHLSRDIFPEYSVGLLHGKMKAAEKEDIMRRFKECEIDLLVATTVIEVGIDIPTASLMVIEHAERFGLSQLHQLRGRVGRGDIPAKCILLAQYKKSEESARRLKVMEQTTDGFLVAEEDLAIRGPGELLGTRQSGLPDFRVASLIRDLPILKTAREAAFALVHDDPKLEKGGNKLIKSELTKRMKGRLGLASTG